MKSLRAIKKWVRRLNVSAGVESHDRVVADLLQRMGESKKREPASIRANVLRAVGRSTVTRVAAAVVAACLIGLAYWAPWGEKLQRVPQKEAIEVPAELAAMPVEELLELHFGERESGFDSELVRAAAERAMSGLSGWEVFSLAKRPGRRADDNKAAARTMGTRRPPPAAPGPMLITGTVIAADVIVEARVDRIDVDADDARAAILEKRGAWVEVRGVEEFVVRVKGSVKLDVFASYPASAAEAGKPLVVEKIFCSTERAGGVEQDKEYLLALRQEGGVTSMLPDRGELYTRQDGVFVVDSNSETVAGSRYGWMPLDHTWRFIMDLYDLTRERVLPAGETLDYWLAKLGSDDFYESWGALEYFDVLVRYCWLSKLRGFEIVDGLTALEYLGTSVQPPVDPEAVAAAIVRQKKMPITENPRDSRPFSAEVYRRLCFMREAIDLLIKLGDANTNSGIVQLYTRESGVDGSFFDMSAGGNYLSLVQRIERLVPSRSPEAEKSLRAVLTAITGLVTADDGELTSFLAEILARHSELPRLIATQMPNACFVPILSKAIEKDYSGDLAWALHACGREEEAVEIACERVRDYVNDPNAQELSPAQRYSMWRTIRLLGTSDSEAASDLLEVLTYPDVFSGVRAEHLHRSVQEYTGPWAERLQSTAITTFARVAGARATERLREVYATTESCYVRIATALSLYYLGDDSGYDLLEHFIKHGERSVPEIEKLWQAHISWGRPFHETLLYLRCPRIEELFLERLRNGVREVDMRALAIASAREREVLPILVEHLNSGSRVTRNEANEMLKRLTGQDFEFSPWRYPLAGKQIEAFECWRAYVDEYLGEKK